MNNKREAKRKQVKKEDENRVVPAAAEIAGAERLLFDTDGGHSNAERD